MTSRWVLAVVMLTASACGGSTPQQPLHNTAPPPAPAGSAATSDSANALVAVRQFTDRICVCADHSDQACYAKVQADMEKWGTDHADKMKDYKPTDDEMREMQDIATRMSSCMQKLMTPVAAGGSATIDAHAYETTSDDLMAKMTAILNTDGKNCDRLGADLGKLFTDNLATLKQLEAFEKDHPDEKQAYDARTKAQQDDIGAKLITASDLCKDNAAFKAALAKVQD